MNYNPTHSKVKKVVKITLLIALITQPSLQESLKRVHEFFITKLEKESVDTSKPLSSQLDTIRVKNQTKYTGTLITKWRPGQLTTNISYREAEGGPIKSTRILTISYPFKLYRDYPNKDLIYSSEPSQVPEGFLLNETDITQHLIDQELYIFSGEVIDSGYLLKSIHAYIHAGKIDEEFDYHDLQIFNFEVYFEDENFVFHIHINKDMYGDPSLRSFSVDLIFWFSLLISVPSPLLGMTIFKRFFDRVNPRTETMTFTASQLYPLTVFFSGFILLKFSQNSPQGFFWFLLVFVFGSFRFSQASEHLVNIYGLAPKSRKIYFYIGTLVVAHLAWFVVLVLNYRFIFYGC